MDHYDVIIIGSGAGGGTLARHLAPSGKRILLLERGDWLPREPQNWSAADVFVDNRYVSPDTWYDGEGKAFQPQVHYCVGGATKMYGAALYRMRAEDFGELKHHGGISPAWPISYEAMEPYYTKAEQLYEVHGARGEDPTEPFASAPYPHPPVSHEPRIAQLSDAFTAAGLHPFHAPCGVMLNEGNMPYSKCVRCSTCDGFPCLVHAKSDAEVLGVRPALEHDNVTLLTGAEVVALNTNPAGTAVTEVVVERAGEDSGTGGGVGKGARETYTADIVVVSCGAANTAKLLLSSATRQAPAGPRQRLRPGGAQLHVPQQPGGARDLQGAQPDRLPEDARRQRLLLRKRRVGVPDGQHPDGGQVRGGHVPRREAADDQARAYLLAGGRGRARRGLLAVDRGHPAGGEPGDGRPRRQPDVGYRASNDTARDRLFEQLRSLLGHLGMHEHHLIPRWAYLENKIPVAGVAHQAGTCRFGSDPTSSALDTNCKAHELDNLYVVDTSFFPSISAVNPALTAMANALRVGDHLLQRLGANGA